MASFCCVKMKILSNCTLEVSKLVKKIHPWRDFRKTVLKGQWNGAGYSLLVLLLCVCILKLLVFTGFMKTFSTHFHQKRKKQTKTLVEEFCWPYWLLPVYTFSLLPLVLISSKFYIRLWSTVYSVQIANKPKVPSWSFFPLWKCFRRIITLLFIL